MSIPATLGWLISAGLLVVGVLGAWHALLFKRDPRSALLWVSLCVLVPLLGVLLYAFFGVNRVRTRTRHQRRALARFGVDGSGAARPGSDPAASLEPESRMLARVGGRATRAALVPGNTVEALADGDAAYPAMLTAIRAAERYVYLASYIFGARGVGTRFIDTLGAAVRRGVDVRVLIDGAGEWYTLARARPRLHAAGVRVERFLPPRLWPPEVHVNLRNHRKILVSDGQVAFTGGINIAEYHVLQGKGGKGVSDLHFRLSGPVVADIEAAFAQDWRHATGEVLPEPVIGPDTGTSWCRVIPDGPNEDMERIAHVMLGVVCAARERVGIMTPYFLPTRELAGALVAAALRGVCVQVILPARNNWPPVHWAARNQFADLLQAGVEIYYQPPPFAHSKFLLIDDHYAQVGSANLDTRSLRLNFELDVEVFDQALAADLWARLEHARVAGRRVTEAEIAGRSLYARTRDALCWLASPYL